MKKHLLSLLMMVAFATSYAQSIPQDILKSIGEKGKVTISQAGILSTFEKEKDFVLRDYYMVGEKSMGKVKVFCQAVVVTNLHTKEKGGFCRITTDPKLGMSLFGRKSASMYFSHNELDDCAQALIYMRDSILSTTPEHMIECRYRTDNLQNIILTYSPDDQKWKISIGGHGTNATKELFDLFIGGIMDAKAILDEKIGVE